MQLCKNSCLFDVTSVLLKFFDFNSVLIAWREYNRKSYIELIITRDILTNYTTTIVATKIFDSCLHENEFYRTTHIMSRIALKYRLNKYFMFDRVICHFHTTSYATELCVIMNVYT